MRCTSHTTRTRVCAEQAAEEVTALARNEIAAAAAAVQASNAGNAGEAVAHKRCVILAGETTVVMSKSGTRKEGAHASASPTGGKGGRCSHMALLVARALRDEPHWCAQRFPRMRLSSCRPRPVLSSVGRCSPVNACHGLCTRGWV
jgi:hypothetical protein